MHGPESGVYAGVNLWDGVVYCNRQFMITCMCMGCM